MGLFGPKMGTWTVHSDDDPRWNCTDKAEGLVCEGGPQEMKDWVDRCTKLYGAPPDDLTVGFIKD